MRARAAVIGLSILPLCACETGPVVRHYPATPEGVARAVELAQRYPDESAGVTLAEPREDGRQAIGMRRLELENGQLCGEEWQGMFRNAETLVGPVCLPLSAIREISLSDERNLGELLQGTVGNALAAPVVALGSAAALGAGGDPAKD